MIRQTHDGRHVIASYGVWLPGAYESIRAARYAFQFDDVTLQRLQDKANKRAGGSGGVITRDDLIAEARRRKAT